MRILLVGIGLSFHIGAFFDKALQQLDYDHFFFDEQKYFNFYGRSYFQKSFFKLFKKPFNYWKYNRDLLRVSEQYKPNVVIITKGAFIAPNTLLAMGKSNQVFLVNFATDDPFNPAIATKDLQEGIPYYDLYVSTKRAIIDDLQNSGCKKVVFVPFGYDPNYHFPEKTVTDQERDRFDSDLVFLGGADSDRFQLMKNISKSLQINIHLYGDYWNRDNQLRQFYRGVVYGKEYRKALSSTKIGLCLLRKANRDGQTMRTFEIPACGSFMLAERTREHFEFFKEGKEFACFSSEDELIDKIEYYLSHVQERKAIAQLGYERVINGRNTYRDRLETILNEVNTLT